MNAPTTNAEKNWTYSDNKRLRAMWFNGETVDDIAAVLLRSRKAVQQKITDMVAAEEATPNQWGLYLDEKIEAFTLIQKFTDKNEAKAEMARLNRNNEGKTYVVCVYEK